jgi:predicted ATPase/Tfp pilus assembly protein PilF
MLDRLLNVLDASETERAEAITLMRAQRAAPLADSRPAPAAQQGASRCPTPLTPLVGREQTVAQVVALFLRPEERLVTLIGPAGVGKTRVAIAAAEALRAAFPDGVLWVPLGDVSDAGMLPEALAEMAGVVLRAGRPALQTLIEAFQQQRRLLVLDNCEHLLAGMRLITPLLEAVPTLRLLATSRERLRLYGETTFTIPPLDLPPMMARTPWAEVRAAAAVQVLMMRMQAIDPTRSFTPADQWALVQTCHLVEGNVLALELAAAQTRWLALDDIARQLQRLLPTLADDLIDRPPRQMSLWHTLAWSCTLLSPSLQALFVRLSIFQGGWTIEAARAVCGAADEAAIERACRILSDKHLIRCVVEPGAPQRWHMPLIVRQYAQAQVEQVESPTLLAARHAAYYCTLAEAASRAWDGSDRTALVLQLQQNSLNLYAALQWSCAYDGSLAARLCDALGHYWLGYRSREEGCQWVARALTHVETLPAAQRAALYLWRGVLAPAHDQESWLSESLALYRSVGDARGSALTLMALAGLSSEQGNFVVARSLLERALELWRELENVPRTIVVMNNLATVATAQGAYADAAQWLNEGLELLRQGGSDIWSMLLSNLGVVYYYTREMQQAWSTLEQALHAAEQEHRQRVKARTLYFLARLSFDQGNTARARSYAAASLEIFAATDIPTHLAPPLELAAAILARLGDGVTATRLLSAATALRTRECHPRLTVDQPWYKAVLHACSDRVSPHVFAEEWDAGQTVALEDIVARAVEVLSAEQTCVDDAALVWTVPSWGGRDLPPS